MKVLITGGGGFLGNQLARKLWKRRALRLEPDGEASIDAMAVADLQIGDTARRGLDGVEFREGDISERAFIDSLVDRDDMVVFHLAAIVSGDGEKRFDVAMRVNFDATRRLLEALRARDGQPRIVFASSLAAYGGPNLPSVVNEETRLVPQNTYGMTKLMGELLINDYSRKGYLDGRAARLPTIFIRPGKPNAAASSFASGVFREPLNGETCELPVERSQRMPLLSYRAVVDCFIRLAELDGTLLGEDRSVLLPSVSYRLDESIATLEKVAKKHGIELGPIVDKPDPFIMKLVKAWPVATESPRAEKLGMKADASLEEVIEAYIEDFI